MEGKKERDKKEVSSKLPSLHKTSYNLTYAVTSTKTGFSEGLGKQS